MSDPLTLAELAALMDAIGGFEARPLIAVAVSGGPDSLALMLLTDRWARQRGGLARGITIDHRLRPESAAEARQVAAWLAAHGIPHEVLVWAEGKPATGIQEAAREARYRLLAEWCRANGCLHLLTAHHREDQAETHLIRRRAGSGVDGLAGIAAVRELPGCRLVRPLLSVPRARLAAYLTAEGQPFLTDPSNRNPAFERARLRLACALTITPTPALPRLRGRESSERGGNSIGSAIPSPASGGGLGWGDTEPGGYPGSNGIDEIIAETRVAAQARIARERALDALLARAVALHPAGFAALDPAALHGAGDELAERLLGRVAATIGVARYPARSERLARLRAGLTDAPAPASHPARTLGGCRFVPWRGRLLIMRELARAEPPVRLIPGAHLLWDRRFDIELAADAPPGLTLGYLGQAGGVARERRSGNPAELPPNRAGDLPRLLYPVLPALWDAAGLWAVPQLSYRRPEITSQMPCVTFRPAAPLTHAGFTVV